MKLSSGKESITVESESEKFVTVTEIDDRKMGRTYCKLVKRRDQNTLLSLITPHLTSARSVVVADHRTVAGLHILTCSIHINLCVLTWGSTAAILL